MNIFKKLKIELPYNSAIAVLGIHPKKTKTEIQKIHIPKEHKHTNSKGYMHSYVYCSIIFNSHYMETAQVPIDRWMDKEDMEYIHNVILISDQKY